MSQALPDENPPIDVDDSYRRSSELDASRPSEWVRRKVLAHASQLGAERSVRESAGTRAPKSHAAQPAATQTSPSSGRTAVFGAVAAVAVVVVFAVWYFLSSGSSSATATNTTHQTEQVAPQVANTSEPSTPSASADQPTAAPPPASAAEPKPAPPSQAPQSSGSPPPPASAMISAAPTTSGSGAARTAGAAVPPPRVSKQTLPATSTTGSARQVTTLKPARLAQSTDTARTSAPAGNSVARNDAPGAQAGSPPVTTVAPTPPPPPSTTAVDPQPAAAVPTLSATSAPALSSEPTQPADALWRAAEAGNMHNLLAALDNHVNVNSRDPGGRTALMLAIVHGQSGAVKALLSHGADPNIPDGQNQTPLHAANAGGQWLIVGFLKHAGAK